MLFTFYSMAMAVLWSSLFILIISVLRRSYYFMDISSVYGIVLLYLFCVARMFIPVEFSWTRVSRSVYIYNNLFLFMTKEIYYTGTHYICVYHLFYGVWALGALALLVRLFYKYYQYNKLIKALPLSTDSQAKDMADKIVKEKYNKNVEVLISLAVDEPVSCGIIHRKILIPDQKYSYKELNYILKHEFIHLKNHDLLVQMFVNILCAIYWWNPFVYFLRNGLEKSFELRCDYTVVKDLNAEETAAYLETILKVFKTQNNLLYNKHNEKGILGTADDNTLEIKERFNFICKANKSKIKPYGRQVVTGIMVCLVVMSYSFILQPAFEAPEKEIETSVNAHEITVSNSYIVQYADGIYTLKTDRGDEFILQKETVDYLVKEEKYKVTREDKNYEED